MAQTLNRCLLCGGSRLRRDNYAAASLNLTAEHGVSRCRDCRLLFLNPRPTEAEYEQLYSGSGGELARQYPVPEGFYEAREAPRLAEYGRKLDILASHGISGRILEIGCCTGLFLNEARQRGFEVEGIEPGEDNRRIARSRFGLELHAGRIEGHDFAPGSFDVVFTSHVFEHLADPLAVARRTCEWVRPGGFLMAEVPNQFNTLPKLRSRWLRRIKRRERSIRSIHHTVFFSPRTLRLLGRLSGFEIVHIRNVYYRKREALTPKALLGKAAARLGFGARCIELLATRPA